ncbi:MAG: hypothetical protein H7A25_12020 [Leptospiraceae bacterium]|nr:hypothetical protein [Leptospiraceae bacterium]
MDNAMESYSEDEIKQGIQEGKALEFRCYTITEAVSKNLETSMKILLDFYKHEDLFPSIYGVIQELMKWSIVANMRYLYFKKHGLDLEHAREVMDNESRFQKTIHIENIDEYRQELKANEMFVRCKISHNDNGLNAEVFNHAEAGVSQERYLRDYLKKAMKYSDIMEYFHDHPEDTDGMGMGLAFSIILLKESGLRPELMRLGQADGGGGYSRIEIPFNEQYISIRDRILKGESVVPFEKKTLVPPEYEEELKIRLLEIQKEQSV